jgi:hypothetical protein
MSDNRTLYIEEAIIGAVKSLLSGRVNELLGDMQFAIPPVEFSDYWGGSAVVPAIALSGCERTEKERIVQLDAYSLSITFTLTETPESELYCYAYAVAVCKALGENPTLGGVADRAAVTGKKYVPPKKAYGGNEWEVVISLRITIEIISNEKGGMNNERS